MEAQHGGRRHGSGRPRKTEGDKPREGVRTASADQAQRIQQLSLDAQEKVLRGLVDGTAKPKQIVFHKGRLVGAQPGPAADVPATKTFLWVDKMRDTNRPPAEILQDAGGKTADVSPSEADAIAATGAFDGPDTELISYGWSPNPNAKDPPVM